MTNGPEDNAASLIVGWYSAHLAAGGARDPVADDLIAETRVEDERGGAVGAVVLTHMLYSV